MFHADYREYPFWWEAYEPQSPDLKDVPKRTRVAIVGAGYAGLATALELDRLGIECVVIDAEHPGYGASTRSGGMVGGAASIKKPLFGPDLPPDRKSAIIAEAAQSFELVESLIEREGIECGWSRTGRFIGAWSKAHYRQMAADAERTNGNADAGAEVIPPERQREEIGSGFYHGGLVMRDAAHLHPAMYYKGLKDACDRRRIRICAKASLEALTSKENGWLLKTTRGEIEAHDVVIATNGYTGAATPTLQRKIFPLRAYIIATEQLDTDLAQGLSPKNRSFADTRRVVSFFRLSSSKSRMIFGSRVKWRDISPTEMAPLLYKRMIDRYPQLAGCKITHSWTGNVGMTFDEQPHLGTDQGLHFAMGCNGSGIAMMTWLGTKLARKIARAANSNSAYDTGPMPGHLLYNGKSRWFVPLVGNYLRLRDRIDRHRR